MIKKSGEQLQLKTLSMQKKRKKQPSFPALK